MSFVSIRTEIDTEPFHAALHGARLGVLLPRAAGNHLDVVEYRPGDPLIRSAFGVPEPVGPALDPAAIDLVVVPGLAFDRCGRRLGYGAGFYDHLLASLGPGVPSMALCFAFQVVERVPIDDHDVPVTGIVTDQGVIDCVDPSRQSR